MLREKKSAAERLQVISKLYLTASFISTSYI